MTKTDTSGTSPEDENLGYEQARDDLAEVVKQLESGGLTLEQSLTLWERGEMLANLCQKWLDEARLKLDKASKDNG